MVTEEEKLKIMEEFMLANENEADDEEEFDDDDDDSDDSDDDNAASSSRDENYAVLQGNLILNDEGRVVFSGTWCMKKNLNKVNTMTAPKEKGKDDKTQEQEQGKKKKTKFKLKSKQVLGKDSKHPFSTDNPLLENDKPRTVLFDGFFTTDETDTVQPYRKIKERDVEIIFSQSIASRASPSDEKKELNGGGGGEKEAKAQKFVVRGTGSNDFGKFCIEGIYNPKEDGGHTVTCSKRYDFQKVSRKKRREYDSEDDYEMSDPEGADMNELIELHDDAELSVEELKKKYYEASAGGEDSNDRCSKVPAKRRKIDDDDDDDGCGF